ncbi:MAG: NAD(P)/FAD-dependent oxidoreductase [Methanolinea sp.]|nr:NAD(P)/FAD-dependent oxidoreductase [Methanolinea sp.]
MPEQFDVVVVGGGPAGTACARLCAEQGLSVCLIEEHTSAGIPVQCAGLLSLAAFEGCRVSRSSIIGTVRGARIVSSQGPVLSFDADVPKAHVVDRAVLDREMLWNAARAGAEVRMKTAFFHREGHRIVTRGVNGKEEISFRVLVAADGARSRIARLMGMPPPAFVLGGLQADISCPLEGGMVEIHPDASPDFFGWAIPIGPRRARVGLAGLRDVQSRFLSFIRNFSDGGHEACVHLVSGAIPVGPRARTYGNRTLFVGDAAGMAKPTSGGGVYTAVRAAGHAAKVIGDAISRNDYGDRVLSRYEKAWREDFGRELSLGLKLFLVRQKMDAGDIAAILTRLDDPRVIADIVALGDMDRPGRIVRRLVTRPELLPLVGTIFRSLIYKKY